MKAHTKETQDLMTPSLALDALKDGNDRFLKGNQVTRNLNAQVDETSGGQYPFATVLHCIDSRVSAEHLFDQGIGDHRDVNLTRRILDFLSSSMVLE